MLTTSSGTTTLPNNAVLSIVGDCRPETAFAKRRDLLRVAGDRTGARDPVAPTRCRRSVGAAAAGDGRRRPRRRRLPHLAAAGDGQSGLRRRRPGHDGARARSDVAALPPPGPRDELAEAASASTMGLIGGTSMGYAYARARDGVTVEQIHDVGWRRSGAHRRRRDRPRTELRRAKAQFERHWLHELARIDSRADAFGEFATLHGDPHLINSRIAEITAIGNDEVQEALHRWFRPDQRATLIYRQEA